MSRAIRKSGFCLCENKGTDQLRGNREADQRLCFYYSDRTIPLLQDSSTSLWLYKPICVAPGARRPVFSRRGSNDTRHGFLVFCCFFFVDVVVVAFASYVCVCSRRLATYTVIIK